MMHRRRHRAHSCNDRFDGRLSSERQLSVLCQANSCPVLTKMSEFFTSYHHQSLLRLLKTSNNKIDVMPKTILKRIRPGTVNSSNASPADQLNAKRNCGSSRTGISIFMHNHVSSSSSSLSSSSDFFNPLTSTTNTRSFSPALHHAGQCISPKLSSSRKCHSVSILKDRFPTTKATMERRLKEFISAETDQLQSKLTDATVRFAHKQLLEISKDCLKRAAANETNQLNDKFQDLSTGYFAEIQAKLQRLVDECESKVVSGEAFSVLKSKVTELLLTISRTAHLVECLEHDAREMYWAMDYLELSMMSEAAVSKNDIAKYIASQLIDSSVLDLDHFSKSNSSVLELDAKNTPSHTTMPTLKDFRMIRILSSGAYGSVALVEHERSGTLMGMKKMSKSSIKLKNIAEQVMNERDILTFTKNPFVVTLYCSLETENHLYLLMEYVECGDLRALLNSLSTYVLPLDLATMYFAETALALEYVHSFGIIHRDVKPSNLLITASGHLKLSDFGLSKVGVMSVAASGEAAFSACDFDEDVRFDDKQVLGSPQYMAPEIILRKTYGKGVDWWSVGIILYEMLVGITPFNANTVDDLFTSIICDPIEWPDDFEHELAKDLIIGLLRRSPELRISRVREHPLFAGFDWDTVLLRKANYVPTVLGNDDLSYNDNLDDWSNEDECGTEDDSSRLDFSFSACSMPSTHDYWMSEQVHIQTAASNNSH